MDECKICNGPIFWLTYPGVGECSCCGQGYVSKIEVSFDKEPDPDSNQRLVD